MEIHIGVPEMIYLFFLIAGVFVSAYESAVKSTNRDLIASVAASVLSGCIEIVLLAWGGFFS